MHALTVTLRDVTSDELAQAAAAVADAARRAGVRVALTGGVAMQHYGAARYTANVDFVAERPFHEGATEALPFGGYATAFSAGECVVPVRIIVRADKYAALYADAIRTAVPVPSLPVPVVRAEELAAMKLAVGREKDRLDLDTLISLGVIDVARAEALIGKHLGPYAADVFVRRVEHIAWLKQRDR
jgi:hypothetical protein